MNNQLPTRTHLMIKWIFHQQALSTRYSNPREKVLLLLLTAREHFPRSSALSYSSSFFFFFFDLLNILLSFWRSCNKSWWVVKCRCKYSSSNYILHTTVTNRDVLKWWLPELIRPAELVRWVYLQLFLKASSSDNS